MTKDEFVEKYKIPELAVNLVINALDYFYLFESPASVLEMMKDYTENADEIYNELEEVFIDKA